MNIKKIDGLNTIDENYENLNSATIEISIFSPTLNGGDEKVLSYNGTHLCLAEDHFRGSEMGLTNEDFVKSWIIDLTIGTIFSDYVYLHGEVYRTTEFKSYEFFEDRIQRLNVGEEREFTILGSTFKIKVLEINVVERKDEYIPMSSSYDEFDL